MRSTQETNKTADMWVQISNEEVTEESVQESIHDLLIYKPRADAIAEKILAGLR